MALAALFTEDLGLPAALEGVAGDHALVATSSWPGLLRLIRERPVTTVGVDVCALSRGRSPEEALAELSSQYPNLGLLVLSHRHTDPIRLFRLGRVGIPNLILLDFEELGRAVPRALQRASEMGATALVTRAFSPYVGARVLDAVHLAMDQVHQRLSAEQFAMELGLSRPFLSEQLKASGLPSAGHLLTWAKLLHAGFWLEEPGRTAESVSRQLEYSSGAAFRRALKLYTGGTPTEVAQQGGLGYVLERLFERCGFPRATRGVTAA
jgi:AraC-like DNA-binding protein